MSFSGKSPKNIQKVIQQKIKQNKNKIYGCPINVKMCKIPNSLGFNTKTKANIISSSYFNLSLKNKANLILKQLKNKYKQKASISRLSNDVNTNYYSLSITNNKTNSINNNLISNNNSNNFSKVSNNSILTNSVRKSKKQISNKKSNVIKEEYVPVPYNKQNNYSFKIKVNKMKKVIVTDKIRNNSVRRKRNKIEKINYNINNTSNNKRFIRKQLTKNDNFSNNKRKFRTKSKDNKNKKIKERKISKKKNIKSMFKKNKLRGNLSVSYSIMDNNNDGKFIDNSYINRNNISSINPTHRNLKNNIISYNYSKQHNRNHTTSCNKKIIDSLLNKNINNKNKKKHEYIFINDPSTRQKNMNQTDVINNGNFEISKNKNIFSLNKGTYDNKFKKKEVLSPKNKFGTNIVKNNGNEKKDTLIRNYHSISENINNLKNIISKLNDEYFNSYNSNINSTSHKRKVIKEIPLPKFVKNKKNEKEEKTTKRYQIAIKDIKIRKINNNILKNSKNNRIRNNNKNIIKENDKKKYIPCINNYDRDDYENEINFEEFNKDKTALNDILRKNRKNNSLIEKKLNLIAMKLDLAKRKQKENKNKQLSPDLHFRLSAKNNDISKHYNKNTIKTNDTNNSYAYISEKKNKKIRIDDGSGEEIKKNNIENNLFDENNLIELDSKVDDKFDDLYSIIKRMNFSSILLNNEGLFSVENKKYQAYLKLFNNFYDIYYLKNLSTVKKVNKSCKGNKNCSASTKTNNTSYKKSTYHQDNNENPIEEFKLLI
jgi:hypothetical protein